MKHTKHFYIFLGVVILFLNACTLQKRSYQKGYYVDWASKKQIKKEIPVQQTNISVTDEKPELVIVPKQTDIVSANSDADDATTLTSEKRITINPSDSCGDMITFKNADMVLAKVVEINDQTIKYKRCDNIEGPTFTVGKEKVSHITYANGVKEIIEPPVRPLVQQIPYSSTRPPYPWQAKWAAILTFVPVINYIGIFIAPFLAVRAKRIIEANPGKYRGINLVKFLISFYLLMVIGIAGIIIALLSGAYILALFFGLGMGIGMIISALYYAFK